jgi:hypothetical protein
MWFKKSAPPLPPIELSANTQLNGTHPPRILTPGFSNWLNTTKPLHLDKDVFVTYNGKQYLLRRESEKTKVLINGQEILSDCYLKDGDFIQGSKWQGIFQADPAGDHVKALQQENELTTSITPSANLRKWLVIDKQGISLDGGENTAKWDEIVTVEYKLVYKGLHPNSNRWQVRLRAYQPDHAQYLPSKLTQISPMELTDLIMWIQYTTPFALSTFNPDYGHRGGWTDAYIFSAYDKLILPGEQNQLVLPTSRERILGVWTKADRRNWFLAMLACIGVLSLILSKPTGFDQESLIRFAVDFVIISAWFGFIPLLLLLSSIIRNLKNKLTASK